MSLQDPRPVSTDFANGEDFRNALNAWRDRRPTASALPEAADGSVLDPNDPIWKLIEGLPMPEQSEAFAASKLLRSPRYRGHSPTLMRFGADCILLGRALAEEAPSLPVVLNPEALGMKAFGVARELPGDKEAWSLQSEAAREEWQQVGMALAVEGVRLGRVEFGRIKRELQAVQGKYNELLYAVGQKHDGEDRHATALRYIMEREAAAVGGPDDSVTEGAAKEGRQ